MPEKEILSAGEKLKLRRQIIPPESGEMKPEGKEMSRELKKLSRMLEKCTGRGKYVSPVVWLKPGVILCFVVHDLKVVAIH
ncbi:MAG: hypothetical protein ACM34M_03545 [Ignavibacteria bacterium]